MDLLCSVCLERERCAMGPFSAAVGCLECGNQVCGVCAMSIHESTAKCPTCRSPSFSQPVEPSIKTLKRLVELWDSRSVRDTPAELRWVPVCLGDLTLKAPNIDDVEARSAAAIYFFAAHRMGSPVAGARLYRLLVASSIVLDSSRLVSSGEGIKHKRVDLMQVVLTHARASQGQRGSPVAQFNAGVVFEQLGLPQRAFRYFSLAARGGHAYAAYFVAKGYEKIVARGQTQQLDHLSAEHYWIAAKEGYSHGYFRLGLLSARVGDLRAFYVNMDTARTLGCNGATHALRLMLNGEGKTSALPPEEPHCCVCYHTESLAECKGCGKLYCSDRCRDLDMIYGPHRRSCSTASEFLSLALNEIFS